MSAIHEDNKEEEQTTIKMPGGDAHSFTPMQEKVIFILAKV
jgi:hypothetical protein